MLRSKTYWCSLLATQPAHTGQKLPARWVPILGVLETVGVGVSPFTRWFIAEGEALLWSVPSSAGIVSQDTGIVSEPPLPSWAP